MLLKAGLVAAAPRVERLKFKSCQDAHGVVPAIVRGADGGCGFRSYVDRITSGSITRYRIPTTAPYNASAIARGPGRSMWVTSNALAGLVKVTVP